MGGAQTKQLGGFRICNYGENSLGRLLELEISFDYIVGIDGVPLTQVSSASHDFFLKRLKGIGRHPVKINIYNSLSTRIRTIILNPYKFNEKSEDAPCSRKFSADPETYGSWKNTFVDGIESNIMEFDAPLNSLRVYQFLSYDQRISGLGVGVHWEEISTKGIKVVNVQEESPAKTSGLVSNDDFIVASSTLRRPFYSTDDFLVFVKKNDNVPLSLVVYNTETEITREIYITPNSSWGGRGLLGCDIAAGPLYDIPLREKEISFPKPHHGKITYIEIGSEMRGEQDLIKYCLREESEVCQKDVMPEDGDGNEDTNCRDLESLTSKTPENRSLVKDHSFDSFRIKQSEDAAQDEKQDIIERALISSGLQIAPGFPTLDSGEAHVFENSQKVPEPHTDYSGNCTSESLLIISNLNEEREPAICVKETLSSSDKASIEPPENSLLPDSPTRDCERPEIHTTSEIAPSDEAPTLGPPHPHTATSPGPLRSPESEHQLEHAPNPGDPQETLPENDSRTSHHSPEASPASSRKSEDCPHLLSHADMQENADACHVICGENWHKDESPPVEGRKAAEDGAVGSGLRADYEDEAPVSGVGQQGLAGSTTGRRENGQCEFPSSGGAEVVGPVPLGEDGHSVLCGGTESVSPEDERAFEIFKKLMETHPALGYEPPGEIEYVDEGEI
ncbi:putative golgi protein [Cryptosporidium canis]|uniref:Golgi protein n=1 Tax=Cryptosporidium canis TaxID=195482 RepID=A0A9D5HY25_9CRYT|nr:putative golgi protein [Cryptosporidium canis]